MQKKEISGVKSLQELWLFRSYILGSVNRDFSLRYKGSVLGVVLVFIVPAFQILLYVLVFGNLLKGRLPGNVTIYGYSIYLCCGFLFWNLFTEVLQRSQNLYLENANLLKKASFPSGALSVVNVTSSSINFMLAMSILITFLLVSDSLPGWEIIGLIPIWLVVTSLALSLGLCIAILQVFFRDFGALTAIALQVLFWGTPIVYPIQILPTWLIPWLQLNPLLAPVSAAQALMLGSALPAAEVWISTVVAFTLTTLFASRLYRQHKSDLMDNL
ncbi:MAG: ABC transporter permease [Gallionella sp.]|nr:ABC transporter permease [Gallionella sp.]MDD4959393.1 ABC transporter permease [Gallionella sp.]